MPRTATAILLTTLWPGGGHAVVRRWWDSAAWTLLAVAVVAFGWLTLDIGGLGDLLDTETLRRLLLVNALLGVVRLAALVDLTWSTNAHNSWVGVAVVLGALMVLAAPHAVVHRMTTDTIVALEQVFVVEARPQTAVLAAAVENLSPPSSPEVVLDDQAVEPDVPAANQRPMVDTGADDRFTVLLLGTDAGYGREGERNDSIMVVSIDPSSLQTAMFGIPRNWGGIPMPPEWPGPDIHADMANTIYQYGWTHANQFLGAEDPGGHASKVVFGDLLGLEIDHFVKVSMEGFVEVIDAMGGIEVNVTFEVDNEFSRPTEEGYVEVDLDHGVQTLSGLEAMGYARSRKTSNDYHRMGRQRCMIVAIADQLTPADLLFHYSDLTRAIGDHVTTDIPLSMVPALIDLASMVDTTNIATVTFVPPLFVDGGDGLGHRKPHVERIHLAVADALSTQVSGADGVTDAGSACELTP